MSLSAEDKRHSSKRPHSRACALCALVPAVLGVGLISAYKLANLTPQIVIPTHEMPSDNASAYFHMADRLALQMKHKSPYDMMVPRAIGLTLANFKGCAIDAEPALAMLRQGLNHPFMNLPERSIKSTVVAQYAEYRELERVNAGAADYYSLTGEPGRTMQMRLDGLEMGVMLPRGGGYIARLVGIACESIAESRIEPLIPQLSSKELASAASRLENIASKRVPASETILEDGYSQSAMLLESLKDPQTKANPYKAALDMMGGGLEDDSATWRERMNRRLSAVRFVLENKSAIVNENAAWSAALAKEAEGPYCGPSKVPIPKNLIAETEGTISDQVLMKCCATEAMLDLIQIEIALARCQKATGRYPQRLADLVPAYLPGIPKDAFGGKALHYSTHKGGGAYLLYSIGPDLKDDRGVPAKYASQPPGDIVAGKLYPNYRAPLIYSAK